MTSKRTNWIDVDLDGLRQILARRGKEFALYELIQNAWDERIGYVEVELTEPIRGRAQLIVTDDSPDGFLDLADAWTMFSPSYKKTDPTKRGAFNLGEKLVLALCDEATITSTTGRVTFSKDGRTLSKHRSEVGTEFRGSLKLTSEEYDCIVKKIRYLIPPVKTTFNGEVIPTRRFLRSFTTELATHIAEPDGCLRRRVRNTMVYVFEPLPGETPTLYEMGIPVVETGDAWHVDIAQKVPLNTERDNVPPSYLTAVRVAVINAMHDRINAEDAAEPWVLVAAGDPRISDSAMQRVIDLRFGEKRVSYDPSDIGSNREAVSQGYVVVSGGSLSAGEWENARRSGAITPAGRHFPTNLEGKVPDKVWERKDWTKAMEEYAGFVEYVSGPLVGHTVRVRFIEDKRIVCGQFNVGAHIMTVNLARISIYDFQAGIELMLHELAHEVVQSNDHLSHEFYDTVGKLGAKLALLLTGGVEEILRKVGATLR